MKFGWNVKMTSKLQKITRKILTRELTVTNILVYIFKKMVFIILLLKLLYHKLFLLRPSHAGALKFLIAELHTENM